MQCDQYELMFRMETAHWWYRALHKLVFASLGTYLPEWREKAILDAGCGTGAILQQLGNPDRNRGVDLSADAIGYCHQRGLGNVSQNDISHLPFADASFDCVVCSSVLYHEWVSDPSESLAELNRVLRPGGLLLVNLPAYSFLHSPHDVAVQTARRFTKREGAALLYGNGFSVLKNTGWTTLLFPLALAARSMGASKSGHDFRAGENRLSFKNRFLGSVMDLELAALRRVSLPFGVAIFLVGKKQSCSEPL